MTDARTRSMAVLIVAYRSAHDLERCILSAQRYLPELDIHVWDNSGPGCSDVRRLSTRIPHVHWYLNSENVGFAAAVNGLAAKAPDHDLLLLNPDAELVGPLTLTRAALRDPGTAAAAPMIWQPVVEDGSAASSSRRHLSWDVAHRRRTFVNALCELAIAAERVRGTWLSNLYRSQPEDVDGYLSGACLAIRREAWNALGHFDEEFFLYGEEAEWQSRAIAAGWRVRLENEIGARHSARGTVTGDAVAGQRSWDLLRAGMALQLEYQYGALTAELYLAGAFVIESTKRNLQRRSDRSRPQSELVITVDGPQSVSTPDRVAQALAATRSGRAVTVVSLQRLGTLPRDLPSSVRLLRRPWWWPRTWPGDAPTVLVSGSTWRERVFARLFRLGPHGLRMDAGEAIGSNHDVESL